ncbi:hypothetical protein THRCLA_03228 [Thraustotheca clavata]|uniref:START domain-containing protein n=1 Tax=Thraustotheca clavata TaxID=74557 RepID=A0A1W0A2N9_9STRA|nr:hypothetical protein THRCLA_03228 [Thraustotheca clavata]
MMTSDINFTSEECDILEALCLTSSPETDESQRKRRHVARLATIRTQRHRKKQQEELVYLKRKVQELQTQLEELPSPPNSSTESTSKWERLARDERKRQYDVMQENSKLKAALEEQVKFAECLVDIIKKRPRLTVLSDSAHDQWQFLKLVAEPKARRAAFHAIADREYAKVDSAFIEAGIVDVTDFSRKDVPKLKDNGDIEIHGTICGRLSVPFSIVLEAAWEVLRGAVEMKKLKGEYTIIDEIDDSTAYVESKWYHTAVNSQSRLIVKKYMEPNKRCVIVSRSIYEDEAIPLDPNYATCNEVSWLSVDAEDNGEVTARFFTKSREFDLYPNYPEGTTTEYIIDAFSQSTEIFENAIKSHVEKLMGGCSFEPWKK